MFNHWALLVGARIHTAVKTPILQMGKLRPSQMKGLVGSQGSRENGSLESESRAPDSNLSSVLVPIASSSDSWREVENSSRSPASSISLGFLKGPVGEKKIRSQLAQFS